MYLIKLQQSQLLMFCCKFSTHGTRQAGYRSTHAISLYTWCYLSTLLWGFRLNTVGLPFHIAAMFILKFMEGSLFRMLINCASGQNISYYLQVEQKRTFTLYIATNLVLIMWFTHGCKQMRCQHRYGCLRKRDDEVSELEMVTIHLSNYQCLTKQ